ncbi:MAG: AbrB/MazE/SpoVT family DNA-binding domain-containing protein [Cyanobacteria bacterium M_surface_7_m2_037]|nr:AbrB/MazE/SpoVT family DNA-binding domain-containing protein [Cyanobacteria bacterium M_surface_7_m2_037]
MRARLVPIGNSRGVRLSKPLLQQAGLVDEVEIAIEAGVLTIRPAAPAAPVRQGWAEAAALSSQAGLIDPPDAIRFDDEDWQWS